MRIHSPAHRLLCCSVLVILASPLAASDRLPIVVGRQSAEPEQLRAAATVPAGSEPLIRFAAAAEPLVPAAFLVEVEPNDSSGSATPLGGDAVIAQGNITTSGDLDYWSFSAITGDKVYVATMTSFSANESTNSELDVLGTDGTTSLEFDDDDGFFGALSSSIAGVTIPSSGTYYVRVKHKSTGQLRPYRLFFQLRSGSPTAEAESNDTPPGQALPVGGWVSGSTSSAADDDLFYLDLAAGDTVFVSLDLDPERDGGEWNGQVGLGLFDSTYLVADDAGSSGTLSEAFFMTVKEAGTYSVLVAVPAGGSAFGTYRLSVTVFPRVDEGETCTVYTSTDVPKSIPTGPGSVASTLVVPGSPAIADLDVSIDLDHAAIGDLDVHLVSPAANDNGLFSDLASAETAMDFTLDDEAAVPVDSFDVFTGMAYAPESEYRLGWYDGENGGGTWTLVIRDDMATAGGTLNGWSIRICEPPALPACPEGTEWVVRYASDFEADGGGFSSSGVFNEWQRGLPSQAPLTTCASGSNCWVTDLDGAYDNSSDQNLVSPAVDLGDLVAPILVSWAQRFQLEDASFDHYSVDLQWFSGGNPSRLFEWLDATQRDVVGLPPVPIAESAGWGGVTRRADAYAGSTVELLFHLDSDDSVTFAGVAIDDVSISGCRSTSYIFADGFESGNLSAWSSSVPGS